MMPDLKIILFIALCVFIGVIVILADGGDQGTP